MTSEPGVIDKSQTDGSAIETRCGFIAVIGAPNAGKSTLVNALVGAKVSIVTHKVQTTRARVRGVLVEDSVQMVFIDTPGIFSPRRKLDRAMVAAAWEGLDGADAGLLVIDAPAFAAVLEEEDGKGKATPAARRAVADTRAILDALDERAGGDSKDGAGFRIDLALNKIDKMARQKLLAVVGALKDRPCVGEVYLIAAETGDGVADFKDSLKARMPTGPFMYPEDQLSDISDRLLAAEITREKLFLRLHQELPYELTVETTDWSRTARGELRIEQTIFLSRDSHKSIVLGKGGQTIKAVGAAARAELIDLLGETTHLFLHAKVRENWSEENARLREMGLAPVG
ncbi:MAG: GTPase Era [Pseudomonadota bacterium]